MTPQELKNSILQLAVQGKLVEQRPEEGTGEELFQQIQAEKQHLIKAGKIKKEKPLPEIREEEKPFEIPESWVWVRLGHLLQVISGVSYKKSDESTKGLRILRGGNIHDGKITLDDSDVFLPVLYDDPMKRVQIGDIIIVASTGSKAVIGKPGYVDRDMPDTMIGAFLRICRPYTKSVDRYLQCIFDSTYYRKHIRDLSQGTNINNVKEVYITEFLIPLPPLAEQKRIVAKIGQLQPYIDRYEQTWNKLETFNKRFPDDMRKSILQLAIQGKLVEQRPDDGSAEKLYQDVQTEKQRLIKAGIIKKEKPLPEIKEEEKPFEIPESWKWVRLGSVLNKLVDGTHRTPHYMPTGVPFVSVRNMSDGKLSLSNTKFISPEEHQELRKRCNPERNDILLSKVGTTGVPAIVDVDTEFSLFVSVALLKFSTDLIDVNFLVYAILTPDFQQQCREHTRGVGNKNWVIADIANTVFPLPPLAEQKRIVAKLEELLPLCDKLK